MKGDCSQIVWRIKLGVRENDNGSRIGKRKMIKTICPYCNYVATMHETLDKQENPINKDISFCINCGEPSVFKDKVLVKVDVETLPKETKEEVNDIRVAWLRRKAISNVKGK